MREILFQRARAIEDDGLKSIADAIRHVAEHGSDEDARTLFQHLR